LGSSPAIFHRPQQVSPETAAQHTAAVDKLVDESLDLLGETSDPIENLSPEEVASLLRLPPDHRERFVQVGDLPQRLIRALVESPKLLYQLDPRKFEEVVAELLAKLGFRDVLLTRTAKDGGRDIVASRRLHGIPISFYFECKRYGEDKKVGLENVRALLGAAAHDARQVNKAVLVTTARFTRDARLFIANEARLDGKDYDALCGWMHEAWTID
jgi:hypothetical protein